MKWTPLGWRRDSHLLKQGEFLADASGGGRLGVGTRNDSGQTIRAGLARDSLAGWPTDAIRKASSKPSAAIPSALHASTTLQVGHRGSAEAEYAANLIELADCGVHKTSISSTIVRY